MKIVALSNFKGGVGKSTLAVNLGCALAHCHQQRVVLVDADPQGTAVAWAFEHRLPIQVVHWILGKPREAPAWINRIRGIKADVVMIDLPPQLEDTTESAMVLADLCLIPVTPSAADLHATGHALSLLREVRQARQEGGKPFCLLIPSKVDVRTAAGREIGRALEGFGEAIAPAVGQRSAFVDAFTSGEWIGQFDGHSKAAEEINAVTIEVKRWLEKV
jgi:chromosome partitioning protein